MLRDEPPCGIARLETGFFFCQQMNFSCNQKAVSFLRARAKQSRKLARGASMTQLHAPRWDSEQNHTDEAHQGRTLPRRINMIKAQGQRLTREVWLNIELVQMEVKSSRLSTSRFYRGKKNERQSSFKLEHLDESKLSFASHFAPSLLQHTFAWTSGSVAS